MLINHNIIPFFRRRSAREGHPCFLKNWHWQTTFSTYSLGYVFASWLFSQSAWNSCSCLKTLLYVFIWGSLLLHLIRLGAIRVEAVYCSWVYRQGSEEFTGGNRQYSLRPGQGTLIWSLNFAKDAWSLSFITWKEGEKGAVIACN